MNSFTKIVKAKTVLGLGEKATLGEIKSRYKKLMKKWHPDNNKDDVTTANNMSTDINEAYDIIMQYCKNFEFPFDEESLKHHTISPKEWWNDKFGQDSNTTI